MAETLRCYRCGHALAALSLPLARLDACPQCAAELHVCRMCERYRPRLPTGCAEDDIEEVRDKERANFCDYFSPSVDAYSPAETGEALEATRRLEALFGGGAPSTEGETRHGSKPPAAEDARRRAEDLFKR